MEIVQVIATVNRMQADGVIERYAIGGAVGATFHIEPVSTLDVDIFVAFHPAPGAVLVGPQPLFNYLTARGYAVEGAYIVISGWPVQFLSPTSALVEEALAEATSVPLGTESASVFTAEHLATIALQVGRTKDKARLLLFIEAGVLDAARFQAILERHQLLPAWEQFSRQLLTEDSP